MTPAPRKPSARKPPASKKPARTVAADAPPAGPADAPASPPPDPSDPAASQQASTGPLPDKPPAATAMPATAQTIATPVEYEVPRPNLLDTGLSDYSFWVSHIEGLSPKTLPPGTRTGRIWA